MSAVVDAPGWFPVDLVEDDGSYWVATSGGCLEVTKPISGIEGTWKLLFLSAPTAAKFYDDQPSVQSVGQIDMETALRHVEQFNREFAAVHGAEECQGAAVISFDGAEWFARTVVSK